MIDFDYLDMLQKKLDARFGEGYSASNPEIVAALLVTDAIAELVERLEVWHE